MPGYPGFGPGVPQLDVAKLDRGSFFETLVPVKSWLHDRGWRQGLRLLIIPYALLPLLFLRSSRSRPAVDAGLGVQHLRRAAVADGVPGT